MDATSAPAQEHRRTRWRRVATAGAATIAVASLAWLSMQLPGDSQSAAAGSGTARPSVAAATDLSTPAAPTSSTSAGTPAAAVSVPWPTVDQSPATVPSSLDGEDFAFWTQDWVLPCCGGTLRMATSGASRVATVDVPATGVSSEYWSEPAGPVQGRVLYVIDDAGTGRLMVADVRSGQTAELVSTTTVIAKIAIDPAGTTAYYLLFDRRTFAFNGLWSVPIGGGGPRPLAWVAPAAGTAVLAATRVYREPQLVVSDDGRWIAVVTCNGIECVLRAIHADGTGDPLISTSLHAGDTVVGIAGDLLIGASECAQATCDGFALDLRTDERWPLGGSEPFPPAQLIAGPDGPMVLREDSDFGRGVWRVEALDLTSGRRAVVFEATFERGAGDIRLAGGVGHRFAYGYSSAGAELPAGWFLIYRNANPVAALAPDYSAGSVAGGMETLLPVMSPPDP